MGKFDKLKQYLAMAPVAIGMAGSWLNKKNQDVQNQYDTGFERHKQKIIQDRMNNGDSKEQAEMIANSLDYGNPKKGMIGAGIGSIENAAVNELGAVAPQVESLAPRALKGISDFMGRAAPVVEEAAPAVKETAKDLPWNELSNQISADKLRNAGAIPDVIESGIKEAPKVFKARVFRGSPAGY